MLRKALHAAAWRIERKIDRFRVPRGESRVIEPYIGYATPDHLVLRGRVLTALRRSTPQPEQSRWVNFRQMLGLFLTNEVADVALEAEGVTGRTDEEGYFTLYLPRDTRAGWQNISVSIADTDVSVPCPVMIARADATFAVVSDIDDTMLKTGAYSLPRNLWTSLTGNALTRQVFTDAVEFMQTVSAGGRNPVYYVSSSPWNLHDFLATVFERAGLVRGPKFLRDLGLSRTQFITGTHGDHKGGSIDTLIAAHPGLPFVLVGDTGQHDAFVYLDAIARHPGRIAAVVLREPGPGPDAESRKAMSRIEETGTPVFHGPTFEGFGERILAVVAERDAR